MGSVKIYELTLGSQSAQCHEYPLLFGDFFTGGSKHVK